MSQDLSIWKARWEAIDNTLDILIDRLVPREFTGGSLRSETIQQLLVSLQCFGREQFYFFYDGFGERNAVDLQLPPIDDAQFSFPQFVTDYPIDQHVFRVTINQITEDITVIQRTLEQRRISHDLIARGSSAQQDLYFTLGEADVLAMSVLKALDQYIPNSAQTTVLTYFHKAADVRVIPYMPVAMIGIPITAVQVNNSTKQTPSVANDILSIPHEVAHYLYWNGQTTSCERFHRLMEREVSTSLVAHWTEEIFADVVSCLVGGAAAALSFMELLLGSVGKRFITTTDVHPTPALRPYIYFRTLEKMGRSTVASHLKSQWEQKLDERHIFANRRYMYAAFEVVDLVLEHVSLNDMDNSWIWSTVDDTDQIEGDFDTQRNRILGQIELGSLEPQTDIGRRWEEIATAVTTIDQQPSPLATLHSDWLEQARATQSATSTSIKIDAEHWLRIFQSDGWTSAGPHHREP